MLVRGESLKLWGFAHMMREFHTQDWGRIIHRVDASACRAINAQTWLWRTQNISPGFKQQSAIIRSRLTKSRGMRCMRTYLPLHPVRRTVKKNLVLECPENRNGEWLNLESRNLVPGDLVKLECGGLVCADEEVLDGKLVRVNTSQRNGAVRINFTAGGETNQVRPLPSSLAAKPAR